MGGLVEIDAHVFDLEAHHIPETIGPSATVGFLSAKGESLGQPVTRKWLLGRADALRDAVSAVKDTGYVGATGDPDNHFIVALKKMA